MPTLWHPLLRGASASYARAAQLSQQQVANIEAFFAEQLPKLNDSPRVKQTRWLGAIGVVETHLPVNMEVIQALFVEHGVWIRPFGRLIYLMPPYISQPEHLQKLVDAMAAALNQPDCFKQ
ncbi:adenosylmethionine-8-amino-7-oxononanoate aminotransferase [Vibrio cholerae MAK 757]|nr:adenosylmethionine-8-amino-7-oxononanoate aminotransferase [Vibrio cholerae MAK 757]